MNNEEQPKAFVEFLLYGGEFLLRLLYKDGKYVCEMPLKEAHELLRNLKTPAMKELE